MSRLKILLGLAVGLLTALCLTTTTRAQGPSGEYPGPPADDPGAPPVSVAWADPAKAGWTWVGDTKTIIVTSDAAGYSVHADFTQVESPIGGSRVVEDATDNGDGTYTITHTLTTSEERVSPVTISVTNPATGATGYEDIWMMTNLDVRTKAPSDCNPDGTLTDESTNFRTVSDFRAVNLVMHCPAHGKIRFLSPLDLTDYLMMDWLHGLGQRLDAGLGKMGLDISDVATYLADKGAEMTLYHLPYLSTPTILMDGADASDVVSDVSYDPATGTLTFTAAHFSTFTAVPTITISEPEDNTSVAATRITVKGSVNDPGATVKIYVNDVDQGDVSVGSDGSFEKEVTLNQHENTIRVTASNYIGDALPVTRTVISTVLPATGLSVWLGVGAGVLIVLGIVFLISAHQRRTKLSQ